MGLEQFKYELYHQGDEPTAYCLVCSRQITHVNKDGRSAFPFVAGMILPENFGGRGIGYIAVCRDCAKHALTDGRINVFEIPESMQEDMDEEKENPFGL